MLSKYAAAQASVKKFMIYSWCYKLKQLKSANKSHLFHFNVLQIFFNLPQKDYEKFAQIDQLAAMRFA